MDNFDLNKKRRELRLRYKRRRIINFTLLLFISVISILVIKHNFFDSTETFNSNVLASPFKETQKIVCIDPGHGDWDSGSIGINNSYEKNIVLNVGLALGKLLENNNIKVVYTRTNDSMSHLQTSNDSLKERLKISKVFKADLFISIHNNSDYNSQETKGIETWYTYDNNDSLNFANIIQSNLASLNYSEDRGIKAYSNKEDAFAVLEKNTATSALVELGFLSNTSDEDFLNSEHGQNLIAESLSSSILEYFNSK